jgi:formylglycine-generating enzyme required for sulfatase activity
VGAAEKVKGLDTSGFPWKLLLGRRGGLRPAPGHGAGESGGRVYHLPTEAQWEYACRAGATTRFAEIRWGDGYNCYSSSQAGAAGRFFLPAPRRWLVSAERLGPYDMHGNVLEWCSDNYAEDYFSKSAVDDPKGPGPVYRVMRGGAGTTPDVAARQPQRELAKLVHNHRDPVACER